MSDLKFTLWIKRLVLSLDYHISYPNSALISTSSLEFCPKPRFTIFSELNNQATTRLFNNGHTCSRAWSISTTNARSETNLRWRFEGTFVVPAAMSCSSQMQMGARQQIRQQFLENRNVAPAEEVEKLVVCVFLFCSFLLILCFPGHGARSCGVFTHQNRTGCSQLRQWSLWYARFADFCCLPSFCVCSDANTRRSHNQRRRRCQIARTAKSAAEGRFRNAVVRSCGRTVYELHVRTSVIRCFAL